MLILTRRPGEMIRLYTSDGVIEVYLHDCNTNQAKLGFVAPANVKIMREEIDDSEEGDPHTGTVKRPATEQIKTMSSMLRALLTRRSTGRQ